MLVQADAGRGAAPPDDTARGAAVGLDHHLQRVASYMRDCGLLTHGCTPSPLRTTLAGFLRTAAPAALDSWTPWVGRAFQIPTAQWPEVRRWMAEALTRWVRHIADPADVDTYVFLRNHARRGFISHFPASRFLTGQMKLHQILAALLRTAYADDAAQREPLLALFDQEFQARILHVTDFFVEGREQELRDQEASYRQATENAPAAIFSLAVDTGAIQEANIVAERTVGYARDRLQTMAIWDLLPATERERAVRLFEETRRRGHARREDLHLRTCTGRLVPVFFNAGLIEYGHHHSFHVICVDISERQRLEGQLIQSEKMAAIGQLAAGIAHEIRNPLGIITNALYDLGEVIDTSNPDVQEDLRIAKEEMGRVQDIINNLLEFSRESGAELQSVNINDLLRKTLQLLNKGLQNSGITVVTDFGALGACLANQNALRQIFLNLISNAVQAMPNGGELRLRTVPLPDGRIRLDFTDTGVGIPPEHLKDIFNPFFTTKAPGQGTGLGLSVVHSVVERYHGEIRVESLVGAGTTFSIEFPCPCEASALLAP